MTATDPQAGTPGPAVRYAVDAQGVATLTLDRPATRNAFDDEMLEALAQALARAGADAAVRCVVLRSSHDKVFSAGGNLKAMAAAESPLDKHARNGRLPELMQALMTLRVPVLCALGGHALAGAFGLAMACDLVIAKEGARVGTPEIGVGVFPFMVSALLQRHVPRKRLAELVYLGDPMTVEEARELGFVNRVVPAAQFEAAVATWAQRLAAQSPAMVALGKRALHQQQDLPLAQAFELLQHYLTLAQGTEDMREGVAAFLEKRAPQWTGR